MAHDVGGPAKREGAARAWALAGQGRYAEAVAIGQPAALATDDADLLRALVGWRNLAFTAKAPATIPETTADQLNAKTLEASVQGQGALIVRGLLGPGTVEALTALAEAAFAAKARGGPPGADYHPLGGKPGEDLAMARLFAADAGVLLADAPRFLARWIEILTGLGVLDTVTRYLGERPALSGSKAILTRISPEGRTGEWHQDGRFLGEGVRTVNLWVALSDCGDDAPSLEVVPKRLTSIVPTGTEDAAYDWSVSQAQVDAVTGGQPPPLLRFAAGDAILFDEMNLHRTGFAPGMSRTRGSIETWFFAPSRGCYITPLQL